MTAGTDEGQRIRQGSPFVGVLTPKEVWEVKDHGGGEMSSITMFVRAFTPLLLLLGSLSGPQGCQYSGEAAWNRQLRGEGSGQMSVFRLFRIRGEQVEEDSSVQVFFPVPAPGGYNSWRFSLG